jgi:hypothetical protein
MTITHRHRKTPEYEIWKAIKGRCLNPTHKQYDDYGGRGISICEEWRSDFMAFLSAVGYRPSPSVSLDRIDNDKGYEPGNVRWTTALEQGNK